MPLLTGAITQSIMFSCFSCVIKIALFTDVNNTISDVIYYTGRTVNIILESTDTVDSENMWPGDK